MTRLARSWTSYEIFVVCAFYIILQARKTVSQCDGTPLSLPVEHLKKFTVETPGYPSGYTTSLTCTWTVDVSNRSDALLITVENVDVDCAGDGITITEEPSGTKVIDLYCGYGKKTSLLVVSSGRATIKFVSNSVSNANDKGLQVFILSVPNKTTATCPATATVQSREAEQFLYSSYFPQNYPVSMECQWTIQLLSGYALELIIYFEDIEHDSNCQYDFIEIKTASSRVIRKSCVQWDYTHNATVLSQINETTIVYIKADAFGSKKGVMIGYRAVKIGENPTTTTTTTAAATTTTTTTAAPSTTTTTTAPSTTTTTTTAAPSTTTTTTTPPTTTTTTLTTSKQSTTAAVTSTTSDVGETPRITSTTTQLAGTEMITRVTEYMLPRISDTNESPKRCAVSSCVVPIVVVFILLCSLSFVVIVIVHVKKKHKTKIYDVKRPITV